MKPHQSSDRITLGIAIAHATTRPGQARTLREIAAYCECSRAAIQMIEYKALRKLRRKFYLHADPAVRELAEEFTCTQRK